MGWSPPPSGCGAGEDVGPGARVFEGEDVVASGGRAVVRLEGGRVVLINEGSRVRFARGGAHAILASGAAYFRVDKGAGPFEVTAGSATVIVKGTRFLVARRDSTPASRSRKVSRSVPAQARLRCAERDARHRRGIGAGVDRS